MRDMFLTQIQMIEIICLFSAFTHANYLIYYHASDWGIQPREKNTMRTSTFWAKALRREVRRSGYRRSAFARNVEVLPVFFRLLYPINPQLYYYCHYTYTGTKSSPLSRPISMLEMDNLLGRTVKQRTQVKALSHYCVWEKRMRSVWKLMK
jgi:hypothetical protein